MITECSPVQATATVLGNRQLRPWLFAMTVEAPGIAQTIRPGQFLMIRSASGNDPLLGRPLAVYDIGRGPLGEPNSVTVVYQVFGRGTGRLSQMNAGDQVRVWGPLGHSFSPDAPSGQVWFVAGGIGYTPFLALGQWWQGKAQYGAELPVPAAPPEIEMIYGARTSEMLPPLDDFTAAGLPVRFCTDDGSFGHHGRVTDLMTHLAEANPARLPKLVVTCGPEPMMAAVARWCAARQVACQVSLENQMACGFGACFSCVAPIRQADGEVDLRRVCLEGPVFDAARVAWH